MNSTSIQATTAVKQSALHAAVQAKLAYWAAMTAIEQLYCADGEVSDKQNDTLVTYVENLAADYPGTIEAPQPDAIADEQVEAMDRIFA